MSEIVAGSADSYEQALRFYADRASYSATGGLARPIDRDLGRRAQQALGIYVNPFEAAAIAAGESTEPPAMIGQTAARKMLETLQHVLHWHDQLGPQDVARVRDAIAEAEGR